jgi:hypothetical protein
VLEARINQRDKSKTTAMHLMTLMLGLPVEKTIALQRDGVG